MGLSVQNITLGVPDIAAAKSFYTQGLGLAVQADLGAFVSLTCGTGAPFSLYSHDALVADLGETRSVSEMSVQVLSLVFDQPEEARSVFASAVDAGAKALRSPKKSLWGGYAGSIQAPDGAAYLLLGVDSPKTSKAFYESQGLKADKDFGDKYIDFTDIDGTTSIALYGRDALAKDVNVPATDTSGPVMFLSHVVSDQIEVERSYASVIERGGRGVAEPRGAAWGGFSAFVADPGGFLWKIVTEQT